MEPKNSAPATPSSTLRYASVTWMPCCCKFGWMLSTVNCAIAADLRPKLLRAAKQAAFEAKVSAEEHAAREAAERVRMREEEIMCLVPPLTVPATPRVVAANAHTLWIEWTAAKADARGVRQLPGMVKYVVSMQGGFAVLVPGAEVMVSYEGRGRPDDDDEGKSSRPKGGMGLPAKAKGVQTPKMRKKREEERKSGSQPNSRPGSRGGGGGDGSAEALVKAGDVLASRVFRGTVKTDNRDGTFNVEYADGGSEQGVPRRRILPAKAPKRLADALSYLDQVATPKSHHAELAHFLRKTVEVE